LQLTGRTIAFATGGRIAAGDPARSFESFSIDTRTLQRGDLFFAIRGARLDGHAFVGAAVEAGTAGVVVSDPAIVSAVGSDALVLVTADTTVALQALARYVRRASGAKVLAITGSAGKTTTKEVAAELLAARYRVFRNRGNLNNHIGLPLSLLDLQTEHEVAVVELGMNHADEISKLVSIAEPEFRVWTNVGDAHLGFFVSVDALAAAKAEILERADEHSVLVANGDDSRVMGHAARFRGRVVTFGFSGGTDVRAGAVEDFGLDGMRAHVITPVGDLTIETPLAGAGNLANVLAAVAIATEFEVPLAAIAERAARLKPAAHRGEVLRLKAGVTVVDDSYNSSPAALAVSLALVASAHGCNRKIAILGEMLELGKHAEALHEASGRRAAATGLDLLVAVGGPAAAALAAAARQAGMSADAVRYVETSDEAAALAAEALRPGDLVFVKGSRGVAVDRVVDRLKAQFS
jgi:UDP-N-acetylmuramoyl-tripeptide--D-alanyl-D-alanine ligase